VFLQELLRTTRAKDAVAESLADLDDADPEGLELDPSLAKVFVEQAGAAMPRSLEAASRLYSFAIRADPGTPLVPSGMVGKEEQTLPDALRNEFGVALTKGDARRVVDAVCAAIRAGFEPMDPGKLDQRMPGFRDVCKSRAYDPVRKDWAARLYYARRLGEEYAKDGRHATEAERGRWAREGAELATEVAKERRVPLISRVRAWFIAGQCAEWTPERYGSVECFLQAMALGHDEPDAVASCLAVTLHAFWRDKARDPRILFLAELWARGSVQQIDDRVKRTLEQKEGDLLRPGLPPLQRSPLGEDKRAPFSRRVILVRVLLAEGSFDRALEVAEQCKPLDEDGKGRYCYEQVKASALLVAGRAKEAFAFLDAAPRRSTKWKGKKLKKALFDLDEILGRIPPDVAAAATRRIRELGVDPDPNADDLADDDS
jgi:hypothetical protein